MTPVGIRMTAMWQRVGTRFLPFADAASVDLPLSRLLRLSLFQVSVAIAAVLLTGTLNRVMIVELHVSAWLVSDDGGGAAVVRAVSRADRLQVGHASLGARLAARALHLVRHAAAVRRTGDHAVRAAAALGDLEQSGVDRHDRRGARLPARRHRHAHDADRGPRAGGGPRNARDAAARGRPAVRHAADRHARERAGVRPAAARLHADTARAGRAGRGVADDGPERDRAVEAGSAQPGAHRGKSVARATFAASWAAFNADGRRHRFLVAVGLGTAAFAMQDVLLEPYGGEILKLPVAATTTLTAFQARRHAARLRAGGPAPG